MNIDNFKFNLNGVSNKSVSMVKSDKKNQINISSAIVRNTEKVVFNNKEVMLTVKKLAAE